MGEVGAPEKHRKGMGMGLSYRHNDLWMKMMFQPFSEAHRKEFATHWTWNACKNMTVGGKKEGSFDNLAATKLTNCAEAHFDNGLKVGFKQECEAQNFVKFGMQDFTGYFNYANG